MKRIEICGGIASGKTTLSHILGEKGLVVVNERFEDNPFLQSFYTKSGLNNAFETEMVFTLLHYNLIRSHKDQDMVVCDYSLYQDYCYAMSNLNKAEQSIFDSTFSYLIEQIGPPDLVVYLKCDVDTLLQRIKERGREMEQGISEEYLIRNINVMDRYLSKLDNVLIVDSDKCNFIDKDREAVLNDILRGIEKLTLPVMA